MCCRYTKAPTRSALANLMGWRFDPLASGESNPGLSEYKRGSHPRALTSSGLDGIRTRSLRLDRALL